jgi:carbamoyl-phosphate synthase large subunit
MTTLLFTGGGGAASEALHRLLRDRYVVHFADADPRAKPCSIPSSAWHPIPLASAPDFLDGLTALCRRLDVNLLLPGVDEELIPIARDRDRVARHVLLPSAEFVETHLDKLASAAHLQSLGIPAPVTEMCGERRRVAFPCIVKPRRGRGSRHVAVVQSEEELRAHVLLSGRTAGEFIVQELLHGQEYTVTMVADRTGTLRAVVPVRVELKRGITLRAATDRNEAVIAACVAIHRAQPVAGCFNIQLIASEAGAVKPFEINPRISTTTCLALAAGVDFVDLHLGGELVRRGIDGLAAFEDGYQLKRSWHNEFLSAGSGRAE